jgi:hypothetical protein
VLPFVPEESLLTAVDCLAGAVTAVTTLIGYLVCARLF